MADYAAALKELSEHLSFHHDKKTIVLLDEYDVPINSAYINGYYSDMISFMQVLLTGVFKDNDALEKAVITGVLRVGKESIFSDLNNVISYTVLDESFGEFFGFTDEEVQLALKEQEIHASMELIRSWYNGYSIGRAQIYNPWSIIRFLESGGKVDYYWVNTSENQVVFDKLLSADEGTKRDLELLLSGKTVCHQAKESISFPELSKDQESVWSLLVHTGYLTVPTKHFVRGRTEYEMRIPNFEVLQLYKDMIQQLFSRGLGSGGLEKILNYLTQGNADAFAQEFQKLIKKSISYYDIPADEPERVYHAFVLGMLVQLQTTHIVKSNRESGYGRYDVILTPKDTRQKGIIIEFKKVDGLKKETLKQAALAALKQIEEKKYAQELFDCGVKDIFCLGMAFQGKNLMVEHQNLVL
jgi:hypothetical protein